MEICVRFGHLKNFEKICDSNIFFHFHFRSAILSVDHLIKHVSLVSINPVFLGNDQNTQEYNELYSITAVIMGIKKKEIRTYKSEVVIQSCIDMHISLLG